MHSAKTITIEEREGGRERERVEEGEKRERKKNKYKSNVDTYH